MSNDKISMYTTQFLGDGSDPKELASVPSIGAKEVNATSTAPKKPATIKRTIILPLAVDQEPTDSLCFMSSGATSSADIVPPKHVVIPKVRTRVDEFTMVSALKHDTSEFTCRLIENCTERMMDGDVMQRQIVANEVICAAGKKFHFPTYGWYLMDRNKGGTTGEELYSVSRASDVIDATIPAVRLMRNAPAAVFKGSRSLAAGTTDDNDNDVQPVRGESEDSNVNAFDNGGAERAKKRKRRDDGEGDDGGDMYLSSDDDENGQRRARRALDAKALLKGLGDFSAEDGPVTASGAQQPEVKSKKEKKDKKDKADKKEKKSKRKESMSQAGDIASVSSAPTGFMQSSVFMAPATTAPVAPQSSGGDSTEAHVAEIVKGMLVEHAGKTMRMKTALYEVLQKLPDFEEVKSKSKDERKAWIKKGERAVQAAFTAGGCVFAEDNVTFK